MNHVLRAAWILGLSATHILGAQTPSRSVHVGFGVDTTIADVHSVVNLVRAYLANPDTSARTRGLWSTANELDRRVGDISGAQAYQGFPATVVGVIPYGPGDTVYVVKVLHASADARSRGVMPLALQRLYAVREASAPFAFRLSNALPRSAMGWEQRSSGRLRFWYAPGQRPDARKIDSAARFVDSIARLFEVQPPPHLDVYVTRTMDEAQRAIGLDFFVEASGPGEGRGGRALGSHLVLIGDAAVGEAYFHEFVHAVLNPTLRGRTYLWSEGVATWLGGSRGRAPREMYVLLKRYQDAHPGVGLRDLLRMQHESGGKLETDAVYATGALIADAVHRRQGVGAVRALATLPDTDAILAALSSRLGLRGADDRSMDEWWRGEAARASAGR